MDRLKQWLDEDDGVEKTFVIKLAVLLAISLSIISIIVVVYGSSYNDKVTYFCSEEGVSYTVVTNSSGGVGMAPRLEKTGELVLCKKGKK